MKELSMLEKRQNAIQELLKKEYISDQEQIVELLLERYNIETNQAVVSRDLRKLGVAKKQVGGRLVYELPQTNIVSEILKLAIIDITYNEAHIVISTQPGLASFVGDAIDQFEDGDYLGCLAGENVVFVAPKTTKKMQESAEILADKLSFKKAI